MEITLKRRGFTPHATEGELWIDGRRDCFTLEDVYRHPRESKVPGKTAIPFGRYRVTVNHSPRFKRRMPLLLGVPGFEGIRIHSGNKPEDTEGCILVGEDQTSLTDAWIGQSRNAYNDLLPQIEKALQREEVWLTIVEEPVK